MVNRRRRRKRRGHGRSNLKARATSAMLVICLSVAAGYFTATYLIGPALGLETKPSFFNLEKETKETQEKESQEQKVVLEDQVEVDTESGYALQYGSFSTKEAAQECVKDLENSGIDADIVEKDGAYKVIGQLFETKEEAEKEKEQQGGSVDVFITQIP